MAKKTLRTVSTETVDALKAKYDPARVRLIVRMMRDDGLDRARAVTLSRRYYKRLDRRDGGNRWNG